MFGMVCWWCLVSPELALFLRSHWVSVTNSGSNSLLLVSFHSSEHFVENLWSHLLFTSFSLSLWGRFGLTRKNTKVFWDLFFFFNLEHLSSSAVQFSVSGLLNIFLGNPDFGLAVTVKFWRFRWYQELCGGKRDLFFAKMKFMKLGSKPDFFQTEGDNIR